MAPIEDDDLNDFLKDTDQRKGVGTRDETPTEDDVNDFLNDTDQKKQTGARDETPFKSLVRRIEILPPLSEGSLPLV